MHVGGRVRSVAPLALMRAGMLSPTQVSVIAIMPATSSLIGTVKAALDGENRTSDRVPSLVVALPPEP